jgi:hypothetical protein
MFICRGRTRGLILRNYFKNDTSRRRCLVFPRHSRTYLYPACSSTSINLAEYKVITAATEGFRPERIVRMKYFFDLYEGVDECESKTHMIKTCMVVHFQLRH